MKEQLLRKLNELRSLMIISVKPSIGPLSYEILVEELEEFKELISKMPDEDLKKRILCYRFIATKGRQPV